MQVSKIFRKAMIDKDVKSINQLATMADMSYDRCFRVMKDKPSAKMIDVVAVASALGLKLKFISPGKEG